jgi:hypothetical protein
VDEGDLWSCLSSNLLNDISWYSLIFIDLVSERSMPMYGISNGLMPKGRLSSFPGVIGRWVQAFQRFDVVLEGVISHKAFFAG